MSSSPFEKQWNKFCGQWLGNMNGIYHENDVLPIVDSLKGDDFDSLFAYKLIDEYYHGKKDRLTVLNQVYHSISTELKRDITTVNAITSWLRYEQFHNLVVRLYDEGLEEGALEDERVITPLWEKLNQGDVFMNELLVRLGHFQDKQGDLRKMFKDNFGDIMNHLKRNTVWLWFGLISFYIIHYIHLLWDNDTTRNGIVSNLMRNKNEIPLDSFDLSYPTNYFSFTIQKSLNTKVGMEGALFQDDVKHLLYHLVNPFPQEESSFARTSPNWDDVAINTVSQAKKIRILEYLEKNEEATNQLLELADEAT